MTPTEAKAAWDRMSPGERLAMAKAAPRVASPWRFSEYPCMVDGFGEVPSWERGHLGRLAAVVLLDEYVAIAHQSVRHERFLTLAAAQSACDAELIRQGFVLDDGGEA